MIPLLCQLSYTAMSKIYSVLIPPAAGRTEGCASLAAPKVSALFDTPLVAARQLILTNFPLKIKRF